MDFQELYGKVFHWTTGAANVSSTYKPVLQAFTMSVGHHSGVRGREPEFIHQLQIVSDLIDVFQHLRHPEVAMILGFMHDAVEDPNQQTKAYMPIVDVASVFDLPITMKIIMLSKMVEGQPNPDYNLDSIFADEDTSVVKPYDRKSNVRDMYGVFKLERLQRYIAETEVEFLPRIEMAAQTFPDQSFAYLSAAGDIKSTLDFIKEDLENAESPESKRTLL